MILNIGLLLLGFLVLIKGADWLVDGASALAKRYRVSDLAVGLTVVAFGTSVPEQVVNIFAAIENHPDIVFGNVIGSNNINLFVILGVAGLITPLAVSRGSVNREIPFSFVALILLFILAGDFLLAGTPKLSRIDGMIMLIFFTLFLLYVKYQMKVAPSELTEPPRKLSMPKIYGLIIIGLAGLAAGGRLVVDNAIVIATLMGVSEKVIGLTIVALGTSLPELATSVVAGIKKNNDIAVGNIIGSNIFNIFLIMGVSSLIRPLSYDLSFNRDIGFLAFGTILLFLMMFIGQRYRLSRWKAALLLLSYLVYLFYILKQ